MWIVGTLIPCIEYQNETENVIIKAQMKNCDHGNAFELSVSNKEP